MKDLTKILSSSITNKSHNQSRNQSGSNTIPHAADMLKGVWHRYKKPLIGCIGCVTIIIVVIIIGTIVIGINIFQNISANPQVLQSGVDTLSQVASGVVALELSYLQNIVSTIQQWLPMITQ